MSAWHFIPGVLLLLGNNMACGAFRGQSLKLVLAYVLDMAGEEGRHASAVRTCPPVGHQGATTPFRCPVLNKCALRAGASPESTGSSARDNNSQKNPENKSFRVGKAIACHQLR